MVLLAWNLLLQIVLLPVYAYIFLSIVVPVNMYRVFINAIVYLFIPFIILRILRNYTPINRYKEVRYLKTMVLMIVIASMSASQAPTLYKNPYILTTLIIPPITVFFLSMPVIDYVIAKILGFNYREYSLLVFTTTARNSEASLVIAASVSPDTLIL